MLRVVLDADDFFSGLGAGGGAVDAGEAAEVGFPGPEAGGFEGGRLEPACGGEPWPLPSLR